MTDDINKNDPPPPKLQPNVDLARAALAEPNVWFSRNIGRHKDAQHFLSLKVVEAAPGYPWCWHYRLESQPDGTFKLYVCYRGAAVDG